MAMNFWEAQRKRKMRTAYYLFVFFLLAVAVSIVTQMIANYFAKEGYIPSIPYLDIYMLGFITIVAFFYYLSYMGGGGSLVAKSMGAIEIIPGQEMSAKGEQLVNIVQEMAVASRMPMPAIYLLKADEINAFAAGLKPEKAAITVTTGALEKLTRDELQGVIGHEFGHIASGDMKMGMRLAALLMGFFLVFSIGLRLLQGSLYSRDRRSPVALIALLILLSGVLLWFAGSILRACVNREREYLADATSVQYTRNPHGLVSALRKIAIVNEKKQDMPKSGLGYSHLFFDSRSFWSRLFATHPPIEKRIAILEGKE